MVVAHRKPLGTSCKLYYDAVAEIERGDVIRTKAGTCYRVLRARQQRRGKHYGRWHLMCVRISASDVEDDDMIHPLYWYPRERKTKQ